MTPLAGARLRSTTLLIALGAAVAVGVAGCVSNPGPSATPRPSASPSASATPTATAVPVPTPTPSPTAAAAGTPTKIPCGTLIPAQVVYDFNPNFGLDSAFTPRGGTAAATAAAANGTACNWLNQTSRDTFTVSVARPAVAELASLRAKAATGTAAAGFGDAAYFSTSGGVGRVDVFRGSYWLTATSLYFASAGDASPLLKAALGALN